MTLSTPPIKNKKKFSKEDLKWLALIEEIKWRDGYKCTYKGCGGEKYFEGKTPYSRKCTKCKHEESATAGTPFHGQRLPISQTMRILHYLIDMYEDYHGVINNNPYLAEKYSGGEFRLRDHTIRASPGYIAERLKMHERTVFLFLSRFMDSLPTFPDGTYITDQWYRGVEMKDRQRYTNLYYIIEKGETVEGIVEMAITKRTSF